MLYKITFKRLLLLVFTVSTSVFISCSEEVNLAFSEINILEEKETTVEINIPKAEGQNHSKKNINSKLIEFTVDALNIDSIQLQEVSFQKGIEEFNLSFDRFVNALNEDLRQEVTPWEAVIEGEVTYQSNEVICIAMNTYMNTGAIHGTSKISFLNFDASSGELLDYNQFIKDKEDFRKFLKRYFEKEVGPISSKDFKLPESLGLSDDGVIVLYNANEIPSYTDKLIEFNIAFNEVKSFLRRY